MNKVIKDKVILNLDLSLSRAPSEESLAGRKIFLCDLLLAELGKQLVTRPVTKPTHVCALVVCSRGTLSHGK